MNTYLAASLVIIITLLTLALLDEHDKRVLAEQPYSKVEMVNNGQIHEYEIDNDRIKLVRGNNGN